MNSSGVSRLSPNGIVSIVLSVTGNKTRNVIYYGYATLFTRTMLYLLLSPSMLSSMLERKSGVCGIECDMDDSLSPLSPDSWRE